MPAAQARSLGVPRLEPFVIAAPRVAVATAILVAGCSTPSQPVPTGRCSATPPAGAEAYDSGQALTLIGTYEVVIVGTSVGMNGEADSGQLTLTAADSLHRYNRFILGKPVPGVDRPLAGSYDVWDHRFRPQPARVANGVLSIGCLSEECTDADPLKLRIAWVSPNGFWGQWEDLQTGLGRWVDSAGHVLPNPAGHFCALRVGPVPARDT